MKRLINKRILKLLRSDNLEDKEIAFTLLESPRYKLIFKIVYTLEWVVSLIFTPLTMGFILVGWHADKHISKVYDKPRFPRKENMCAMEIWCYMQAHKWNYKQISPLGHNGWSWDLCTLVFNGIRVIPSPIGGMILRPILRANRIKELKREESERIT